VAAEVVVEGGGMSFGLDRVVPWGRSFTEYVAMFALSRVELGKRILGCGDGPAGFNAALSKEGGTVLSIDPLYRFSGPAIAGRIAETRAIVLEQARQNAHEFVWSHIRSVEELGRIRMAAMAEFLADFPQGGREGRYLAAALPDLPLAGATFDLALCSHLLFLYSAHLDLEFHLRSVRELCRVAAEVRIFPILELGARRSRHVEPVLVTLAAEGYAAEVVRVGYEFQRGGDEMLRIRRGTMAG
jgi:hypothetical protein